MGTLLADVDEIMPGLVADRRWLHEHPELGMQEVETARFVTERLQSLGVEDIRTGISETGVTALVRGTGSGSGSAGAGKVVLLRADMDALPIEEENDVEYRSQNPGVMHACGHDGHTAMLLATTRLLMERRHQFAGTVKVVFQPSEETGPGGAEWMIRQGVLENPHVDAVFGLHLAQSLPVGTVSAPDGPTMSGGQFFSCKVQGRGGHGAMPHLAADPIVAACAMITQLQTIVSRNVNARDTVVLSVGTIHGGKAANVIPDTVEFAATFRVFSDEVQKLVHDRIVEILEGTAAAMGVSVEIAMSTALPAVINDPAMSAIVRGAAAKVVGEERAIAGEPWMASEDFSYFLNERPGSYFFVGSRNEERGLTYDHHHPKFNFDEEALGIGVATMTQTVLDYFQQAG